MWSPIKTHTHQVGMGFRWVRVQVGQKVHGGYPCRPLIMQYVAGGVFQYIDNGFRLQNQLGDHELAKMNELKRLRYKMGIELFSTLDELQQQMK
jgi:hypothetical protein